MSDAREGGLYGPGGGGDSTPNIADDIRRLEEIDTELGGVEAALRRLDDGSYGKCDVCAAVISPPALERDPLAARCPDHAA